MFKTRPSLLKGVVVFTFVIGLSVGLLLPNDAYATKPVSSLELRVQALEATVVDLQRQINELAAIVQPEDCHDFDGDGYYSGPSCSGTQDCNDNNAAIHPGAQEICGDHKDNNCNGQIDEGCPTDCIDNDGDGYGVGTTCLGPDCNDNDQAMNPGAQEICDGVDNNCDGQIDEGCCVDNDGDGYGGGPTCGPMQDCDDYDATIYPGAPEMCGDYKDNNCNGSVDEEPCICTDDGYCALGYFCNIVSTCELLKGTGVSCLSNHECNSNSCVGVCN